MLKPGGHAADEVPTGLDAGEDVVGVGHHLDGEVRRLAQVAEDVAVMVAQVVAAHQRVGVDKPDVDAALEQNLQVVRERGPGARFPPGPTGE